ncbi:MAG: chorismate mutase [Mycetocola sp.]
MSRAAENPDSHTAENPVSLTEMREAIDAIDQRIVELIAERQQWVIAAGGLKADETAVRAPDRVERVVAAARQRALEAGASPDVVEGTYRAMIAGFIGLELAHHREQASEG